MERVRVFKESELFYELFTSKAVPPRWFKRDITFQAVGCFFYFPGNDCFTTEFPSFWMATENSPHSRNESPIGDRGCKWKKNNNIETRKGWITMARWFLALMQGRACVRVKPSPIKVDKVNNPGVEGSRKKVISFRLVTPNTEPLQAIASVTSSDALEDAATFSRRSCTLAFRTWKLYAGLYSNT